MGRSIAEKSVKSEDGLMDDMKKSGESGGDVVFYAGDSRSEGPADELNMRFGTAPRWFGNKYVMATENVLNPESSI